MLKLIASPLLTALLAAGANADVPADAPPAAVVVQEDPAAPPVPDRLKPIGEVQLPVADEARMPRDLAAEKFGAEPHLLYLPGISRPWGMMMRTWEAPGFCHRPLYFEEEWLERYGYSYGIVQPAASAVNLGGRVLALPALMIAAPPHECVYTLGRGRPGNCNIGP
jgi:hypothetical protein